MYRLAQSVVTRITGPKIEPLCLENLEFTRFRSPQIFLETHFWKRVPPSILERRHADGLVRVNCWA
jgi:hypothetical protein